ncbi:guanylate kinase [Orbus hercynius]|uniref:Guanylate kinase n=1 Tax=Orbus hercynius TaxID=593135 RepID=A0A495RCY9_9GAMM|nr:guanylate kinase [Orbus hercynius]RKS85229.1 guanylate kinase [Orbus hercynius]
MYTGTLFIVSAPSGAGKSSLINAYLKQLNSPAARVSISHTTRSARPGENHAEHYYFVDHHEFETLIQQDEFIEYAKVFDNYYGTSKAAINQYLKNGINVFLDIDWQGARQVRNKMPTAKSIFILPPSLIELEKRLIKREQDSAEIIAKRMAKAQSEMSHYNEYNYLIINDDFDDSLANLSAIIKAESLSTDKQNLVNQAIIDQLLTN